MKKIALPVVVLVLLIAVVWQYRALRRMSPPEDYEYKLRTDIDLGYHRPELVRAYFDTGYMVGSFAREMWHSRGLNVRLPDSDNLSDQIAVARYNHLRGTADSIGMRLSQSLEMKKLGLSNADIAAVEMSGHSATHIRVRKRFGADVLRPGDRSQGVFNLQGILHGMGFAMPQDGFYAAETEAGVREYQRQHQLFPTGIADLETLTLLAAPGK